MMNKSSMYLRVFTLVCALVAILGFAPVGSAQVLELKPNLQPFPASELAIVTDYLNGGTKLVFSTTSWNSGLGPMELVADAGDSTSLTQQVKQRVYSSDGSYQDSSAGVVEYHPEHGHFHFDNYALYTLQPVNAPGGSQRTGSKTTFCLMDTTKVNTGLPGAPGSAVYTTCGASRQGISVGWGDRYGYNLPGQSLNFTGNPNGDYLLKIEIDPQKRLLETNNDDNTSCVLLRVNNRAVQVLGTSCDTSGGGGSGGGGAVTVSGISPTSVSAGGSVDVTISGSGFASGVGVSFENGAGGTPIASNITVLNANTITARVTVKSGGPPRDRVWDVRVGSGVLDNGFTVVR